MVHDVSPIYTVLVDTVTDGEICILVQVSLLIRRELYERAKDFNIILDDVAITELSFSREYTAAVEAKQVGKATTTARVCVHLEM